MHQCGKNFFKILSAVSEEDMNLVQNFLMRLGTLKKKNNEVYMLWLGG